jgi:o-succinylbenzoate synthase
MMTYKLHLKPYRRRFCKPLKTAYGLWSVREGLLVGLQREDAIGWGEVAPLPWFGTETLESAIAYCNTLPLSLTQSEIFEIPDTFPACQFGFGSAWDTLTHPSLQSDCEPLDSSGLLPAGEQACSSWLPLWQKGYRTFKWKIGVLEPERELQIFQKLAAELPEGTNLRLDANGGLTLVETHRWLENCDCLTRINLEYLEQPLPADQVDVMHRLSREYRTPLALDESVATLQQLMHYHKRGWQGVMVVKPAIAGYPQDLRAFLQSHSVDTVFSSVFETEVGRNAALKLAQDCENRRAVGFGVEQWFTTAVEYDLEPAHI